MRHLLAPLVFALISCTPRPAGTNLREVPGAYRCSEELHLVRDSGSIVCPPGVIQHGYPPQTFEGHVYMLVSCDCKPGEMGDESPLNLPSGESHAGP